MKRIRKFLSLSTTDQRLLLKSAFLLGAIALGLRVLSFRILQRFLAGMTQRVVRLDCTARPSPERIAWAVRVARRYVPAATCLSQALAVRTLFRRQGYPAQLRIGVTKGERGQLEAHAWVESEGKIVIGGSQDLARYTPLPSLQGESA
jgi:hypothetical protein